MILGKQLDMGDVEVNWDDAMNPFTYDASRGCNMFDASKTAHNQRVAIIEAEEAAKEAAKEAEEKAKEEQEKRLEALDNALYAKHLEDICAEGINVFISNDDNADKVDCSVLKDLFNDYLETTNTPTSGDFLTYLYALDVETAAEIYVDWI